MSSCFLRKPCDFKSVQKQDTVSIHKRHFEAFASYLHDEFFIYNYANL